MLQVGYLSLENPIAVVEGKSGSDCSAGLLLIEGYDLDEVSVEEIESSLKESPLKDTCPAPMGISVRCTDDDPLIDAARLAGRMLLLLEIDFSDGGRLDRLGELVARIKRCGTTLSVRLKPEDATDEIIDEFTREGVDIIHLDLSGENGAGPRIVKRAADHRGPRIMAMGNIGEFDDARSLMAMGADMVSLRRPDPEFADWLSKAFEEYDHLSGWYNAPKHICSGGDLRGLAFCCPPVKHCPVMAAIKRAGMSPEEFVEKKLKFAHGTPLEKGEGTCFGSLAWCCKISKPCYLRDAALKKMGLSQREYMSLKRKLSEQLLKSSSSSHEP